MPPRLVHRLCARADWENARAAGVFEGGEADRRDGFIHLSSIEQLAETARIYFPYLTDVWVLDIDVEALGDALKWETSRGGKTFPHCHAPIPLAAIRDARPYVCETAP